MMRSLIIPQVLLSIKCVAIKERPHEATNKANEQHPMKRITTAKYREKLENLFNAKVADGFDLGNVAH